jgi:ABC-type sugar transport system permease subunit
MKDARLGWALALPAVGIIAAVAVVPIGWTIWESLHLHDLRMPWLGRPLVGLANYREAIGDPRFRQALAHTAAFAAITVALELAAGLLVALALERMRRARGLVRTAVLLPWAMPTVVVALVWRFLFESPDGLVNAILLRLHLAGTPPTWFADAVAAWVPIVLADVWKTTPFVAILLLAGLQNIDPSLYEAARVDGAGRWRTLFTITLPLLRPAILVAFLFRTLDAFRVFDLVYVMTGGGPGTATEPIAVYTFATLLQNLRFGYGAALSVVVFAVALLVALATILLFGRSTLAEERA